MRHAADTPDERMREYDRLFAGALLDRERRDDAIVLRFGGGDETRTWVEDLARREAACCPFADYRVEADGDSVTWTITNTVTGDERANVDLVLDAYYAMPDNPGLDLGGLLDAC
jgi:hypothetical protein